MGRCFLVVLWFVVHFVGLIKGRIEITSPNVQRNITVVILNEFLGPQNLNVRYLNTKLVLKTCASVRSCVNGLNCGEFFGAVVFLDVKEDISWQGEFNVAKAFADCHAKAVVRTAYSAFGDHRHLGFSFHNRDEDCCRDSSSQINIPVLSYWIDDLVDLFGKNESTFFGDFLDIEENPWDINLFDTSFFKGFFLIFIPILNGISCFMIIRAMVLQKLNSHFRYIQHRRVKGIDKLMKFVQLALFLDLIGCILRIVYCSLGPIFSNSYFTFEATQFLINISVPVHLPVIFLVATLFRRLTSIRGGQYLNRTRLTLSFFACLISTILEMLSAYFRATRNSFSFVLTITIILTTLVIFLSTIIFFIFGFWFLFKLHKGNKVVDSNKQNLRRKQKSKRNFSVKILLAALAQLLTFFSTLLIFMFPKQFLTYDGISNVYIPYFLGFTVCSIFHALAFTPRSQDESNVSKEIPLRETTSEKKLINPPIEIEIDLEDELFDLQKFEGITDADGNVIGLNFSTAFRTVQPQLFRRSSRTRNDTMCESSQQTLQKYQSNKSHSLQQENSAIQEILTNELTTTRTPKIEKRKNPFISDSPKKTHQPSSPGLKKLTDGVRDTIQKRRQKINAMIIKRVKEGDIKASLPDKVHISSFKNIQRDSTAGEQKRFALSARFLRVNLAQSNSERLSRSCPGSLNNEL